MGKAKQDWTIEEFVTAWVSSDTLAQVKEKLKAPNVQSVTLKAAYYRRQGIPLKTITTPTKQPKKEFDPNDKLKALKLIASLTKTTLKKVEKEGIELVETLKREAEARKVKREADEKKAQPLFEASEQASE